MLKERQTSFLFGGNAPYVEEQYERYLDDPASVTDEWRAYFDALRETPAIDGSDRNDEPHAPVVSIERAGQRARDIQPPSRRSAPSRTDEPHIPLDHVGERQGRFTVTNSILSEAAVLAFEYGYSTVNRNALVIWEAQFGDFANGAQVVIDQFIAAGAAKWGQQSGLTLFLPHGQEGAGPEHASARLERYLQLGAEDNMRVTQPTTPAQLFHLLRMQALAFDRRPLVVMTPKSLLRHPEAVSTLDELSQGTFREILPDSQVESSRASNVERVIVTSGKVYYELLEHRRKSGMAGVTDTPIIRVEQLYPFPARQLAAEFARYPNLKTVVWCQEESRNQGGWSFVEPQLREILPLAAKLRYAGPAASASTAPGYHSVHAARQAALVVSALAE